MVNHLQSSMRSPCSSVEIATWPGRDREALRGRAAVPRNSAGSAPVIQIWQPSAGQIVVERGAPARIEMGRDLVEQDERAQARSSPRPAWHGRGRARSAAPSARRSSRARPAMSFWAWRTCEIRGLRADQGAPGRRSRGRLWRSSGAIGRPRRRAPALRRPACRSRPPAPARPGERARRRRASRR